MTKNNDNKSYNIEQIVTEFKETTTNSIKGLNKAVSTQLNDAVKSLEDAADLARTELEKQNLGATLEDLKTKGGEFVKKLEEKAEKAAKAGKSWIKGR